MTDPQSPTPQLTELRGQVALVTGASSGIGEAVTEALVKRGANVAMFARRTDRLEALATRLASTATDGPRGETLIITGDVREADDVQAAVQKTLDRWGHLDALIANAGFGGRGPLVEGDIERWKDMIDTNVYGLLLTLRFGVPALIERGRGNVIIMSSVAAVVPTPGGAAYCGTKAAASAIADSLRQEIGPKGVRVTTIEPGVVISEFQEKALYAPEIVSNMLKGATPLVPDDIARAMLFALEMPAHMGVNELVVRPTGQAYP